MSVAGFENLVISYKCKTVYVYSETQYSFENLVNSYKCKTRLISLIFCS